MNRAKKTLLAASAAAAVALLASGCSSISTAPDQAGIVYDAGMWSSTKFQECVEPGTLAYSGPGDLNLLYPFGLRTYDFSTAKGAESTPLSVVSKDRVEMTVAGGATFTLNTTCGVLQKFHESIGLKYKADIDQDSTGEHWANLLNFYLGKSLDQAMDKEARKYNWQELADDPTIKATWQDAVEAQFKLNVVALAGGDYFQNLAVQADQPKPPASIQKAREETQKAIQENLAQKERNAKGRTELELTEELVKVLGPNGAILWQAIQKGQVSVIPVPTGVSMNVNPPK